jgi:hypothetical protein
MAILANNGDILELRLNGKFDANDEVFNMFHYRVDVADGATLQEFGCGLYFLLNDILQEFISSLVTWEGITVSTVGTDGQLINGELYPIPASGQAGLDTAQALPPFVSYSFRFLRPSNAFRHGWKRFAGVTEATQEKGRLIGSLTTLFGQIASDLNNTRPAYSIVPDTGLPADPIGVSAMTPVLIQRVLNGDQLNPVVIYDPAGCVFQGIGSQNTRKFGRGA